jgi:hypothetical protein
VREDQSFYVSRPEAQNNQSCAGCGGVVLVVSALPSRGKDFRGEDNEG